MSGPLDHYPGLLGRSPNRVDLQVQLRDRPNVTGVRLWASHHIHHLYGARTNSGMSGALSTAVPLASSFARALIMRARPDELVVSPGVRGRRFTHMGVTRGVARFLFDPADFPVVSAGPALAAGTSFNFNDVNPDTIDRNDAGDFIADGFVEGMSITITNATNPANNGTYTIAPGGVAVGTLTLTAAAALTNSLADLTAEMTSVVRSMPSDDQMMFLAIQQERATLPLVTLDGFTGRANVVKGAVDTGDRILGPILIVPTAQQARMQETTLVVSGHAPQLGPGVVAMAVAVVPTPDLDLQIPNPLHLVLPRPTTSLTVRNTDGVSNLLVSHGLSQQVYVIPAGAQRIFFGATKEVCLMSDQVAATCTFSVEANINFGGAAGGV